MTEIVVKAPAKINLGLKILNKRQDGYHNIETVFYPINLFDKISFRKSSDLSFNTNSELLNTEENNLILKAIKVIEHYTGIEILVDILLEKNIPIGAGLGGGSSDAAATLTAINKLFELNLSGIILRELAIQLGSDVPFFIDAKPAYAVSRGEVLKKINFNITEPILIVYPNIHISTKWAYKNVAPAFTSINLIEDLMNRNYSRIENDFEPNAFTKYSEIKKIKAIMHSEGALLSLMSGSGSTIFGIFPNIQSATKTKGLFDEKYFTFIHHEN